MRKIKFRGKRKDGGELIYGNYGEKINIITGEQDAFIMQETYTPKTNSSYFTDIQIDIKTAGQYTGLKDENGKEIYECDIVKHGRELDYIDIVEYENCCFHTSLSSDWLSDCENIEVIGNIYENPELLEDK